jgi:hypothetical protein
LTPGRLDASRSCDTNPAAAGTGIAISRRAHEEIGRMSKPLIVTVPHQLGRAEARRRLENGIGQLRAKFGDKVTSVEDSWTGDRLDVHVQALGQSAQAQLDVADDHVRVEVQLPWMLAMVAEKAKGFIQKEGTLLFEKK